MLLNDDNDLRARLLNKNDKESSPPTIVWLSSKDDDPNAKQKRKKYYALRVHPIAGAFLAALLGMFCLRYYTKAIYETIYSNGLVVVDCVYDGCDNRHQGDSETNQDDNNTSKQRIVILGGPVYPPDGTSLPKTFYGFAGQTVWIDPAYEPEDLSKVQPHPAFEEWSYPVGLEAEFRLHAGWRRWAPTGAFFHGRVTDALAGKERLGRLSPKLYGETEPEQLVKMAGYFRDFFRVPWSEGKNLLIGIEHLAWLFREEENATTANDSSPSWCRGNDDAKHIDPLADEMLERLLDVLPNQTTATATTRRSTTSHIEVVLDYRTPRIENAIAIWRKNDHHKFFRYWLATEADFYLPMTNTLLAALQLVRKGIRVTLVDSAAAAAAQASQQKEDDNLPYGHYVATPLEGIVACEVLGMAAKINKTATATTTTSATTSMMYEATIQTVSCDAQSRLHLPRVPQKRFPRPRVPTEPGPRDFTEEELDHLEAILERYDCGIWKYLRGYQKIGLLNVLPPGSSENRFAKCRLYGETPSFADTIRNLQHLARRDVPPAQLH